MLKRSFALEPHIFALEIRALSIISPLVMLVRYEEKSSLLSKVIPSTLFVFTIFNSNVVRYETYLKFDLNGD